MKNVKRDKNSPVEMIEGRLKRLLRMKLMVETDSGSGKKRVGGRENKGNLEGGTDEYLEEKTPVERKQRLRTSRMDTRLRTPAPRRKRVGGWGKNN